MPIRPIARTVQPKLSTRVSPQESLTLFESGRINGGMVTVIDSADLEPNQATVAKNVTVRYDKTARRPGYTLLNVSRPNSNKVMLYVPVARFDRSISILRFTPSTVHLQGSSSWTQLTGTLAGTNSDRFNFTAVDDRFFFSNNGKNNIKEVDFSAGSFADIATDLEYRYITSFYDRLVALNYGRSGSENPILVAWSGERNYTEFDPLVDISAGSTPLIESQADYADEITGGYGFASQMLILRKFSLWGATKQPVATSPFFFATLVPNIGSDAPYSVQQIPNGLIWYDKRTSMVYEYLIGQQAPTPVGVQVNTTITAMVSDPKDIFSSYDPLEDEYMLALPTQSTVVRVWIYNRRTKAWSYDEYDNLSSITNTAFNSSSLKINDLVGKINDLVGKIDGLSPSVEATSRFFGFSTGNIAKVNPLDDKDEITPCSMELQSKTYTMPVVDYYVGQFRLDYQPRTAGSFTVSYSKDAGDTWTEYRTVTFSATDVGKRKLATFSKNLKCRQFTWKVESSGGICDLIGYEIHVYPGAVSK